MRTMHFSRVNNKLHLHIHLQYLVQQQHRQQQQHKLHATTCWIFVVSYCCFSCLVHSIFAICIFSTFSSPPPSLAWNVWQKVGNSTHPVGITTWHRGSLVCQAWKQKECSRIFVILLENQLKGDLNIFKKNYRLLISFLNIPSVF